MLPCLLIIYAATRLDKTAVSEQIMVVACEVTQVGVEISRGKGSPDLRACGTANHVGFRLSVPAHVPMSWLDFASLLYRSRNIVHSNIVPCKGRLLYAEATAPHNIGPRMSGGVSTLCHDIIVKACD